MLTLGADLIQRFALLLGLAVGFEGRMGSAGRF
jgi:hypothetical protein